MSQQKHPPIKTPDVKPVKRLPMVGWYDPRQLAKTGVEVAVSTIFGRHSDHRLVEAMAAGDETQDFFDYSCYYNDDGNDITADQNRKRDSIWIDYAGDVGDGWNSTYAIAYNLAKCESTFTYTDSKTNKTLTAQTKRGDVLVFGGDEVYPTASRHHGNEAFSSLSVEDWKNFVRLHINEQGDLTIYPIGIRRVPRKWKPRNGTHGPELEPDDRHATNAELIEPPIVMKRAATETGVKADPTAKATVSYDKNGQAKQN